MAERNREENDVRSPSANRSPIKVAAAVLPAKKGALDDRESASPTLNVASNEDVVVAMEQPNDEVLQILSDLIEFEAQTIFSVQRRDQRPLHLEALAVSLPVFLRREFQKLTPRLLFVSLFSTFGSLTRKTRISLVVFTFAFLCVRLSLAAVRSILME